MPFSEDLTKKAQQVAGAAAEKAKDLAGTATEMAKAAIDTAKMNMEILSEQREIEKNYRAIGEWFVSEFQGEVPDAVKDVVAAVNASKEKIAPLEASKKKETAQEAEPVYQKAGRIRVRLFQRVKKGVPPLTHLDGSHRAAVRRLLGRQTAFLRHWAADGPGGLPGLQGEHVRAHRRTQSALDTRFRMDHGLHDFPAPFR